MLLSSVRVAILLLVLLARPVWGQIDEGDPLLQDTTDILVDSTVIDTVSVADTAFIPISDNDLDLDLPEPTEFWSVRNGGFLGGLVEFSGMKPSDLDPRLDGDLVVFGGQGYLVLSGWLMGGIGTSAVLYNAPASYDEFSFGYGGFLFGYDQQFARQIFSAQARTMIGRGGLRMIRKRPDIVDPGGLEILERVREESFFAFRPEASIGFQPVGFLEFRLSAAWLLPVGGARVNDLAAPTYGIHVALGVMY